jgi:hypothetical protein
MLKIIMNLSSYFWTFLLVVLILPHFTYAAALNISQSKENSSCKYSIIIDEVEVLAGIKLVIHYPKNELQFESATKGPAFKSFMHVVNDKNPGKLIVVMAKARGISGLNLPLFEVKFSRQQSSVTQDNNPINIVECQLMSDTLQEISCSIPKNTTRMSSP